MTKPKRKSKKKRPNFEIILNHLKRRMKLIFYDTKSIAYVLAMGNIPDKEGRLRLFGELDINDWAVFERIMNSDRDKKLPSCVVLLKSIKKVMPYVTKGVHLIPDIEKTDYNRLNVSISIGEQIGRLPFEKFNEKFREKKLKWTEGSEIADEFIKFAMDLYQIVLYIDDEDLKAAAVYSILSWIIFLEQTRDNRYEKPIFNKDKEDKQRILKCKEYGINPILIRRSNEIYERAIKKHKESEHKGEKN